MRGAVPWRERGTVHDPGRRLHEPLRALDDGQRSRRVDDPLSQVCQRYGVHLAVIAGVGGCGPDNSLRNGPGNGLGNSSKNNIAVIIFGVIGIAADPGSESRVLLYGSLI